MTDHPERINWYRTPIDKEVKKSLMQRSDLRGWIQSLGQLLMFAGTGTLAFYAFHHWAWPLTLAAFYLHGTCYWFIGEHAAIHELSHGTVFKTKVLNEFFLRLFGFLTWKNIVLYRESHIQHHMCTVYRKRDLEVPLPVRISPLEWIGYFTVDLKRLKTLLGEIIRHSFGVVSGEWEQHLFPASNPKARRQLFNCARYTLAGQILMIAAIIYFQQWILLAIVTFPFYASWLVWMVTYPQHAGLQPNVPDFRLCCRSVKVNPVTHFLHWNMDYHVEHHMHAGVPFYNLPRLRKVIGYDLPEMETFAATWKKLFPVLRRQRTEPDFFVTPELPRPTT